jgi:hypothetical protein
VVPSVVKSVIGRVGGATRYFLVNLERRLGHRLRSLVMSRSYRILDNIRIIPASAIPRACSSHGTTDNSFGPRLPEINYAGPAGSKYSSDQYSQIEITSASNAAAHWTGVAVRISDDGQAAYIGICKIDHGKSELILCKRTHGKWSRLGRTYRTGPLGVGTRLRLVALGSTIAFMENGVIRIVTSDNSLSDGMPGVMVNGAKAAGKLSVGPTSYEVHHLTNDSRGIAIYSFISATNPGSPRLLRVLRPARPSPRVPHNFLFVLPVEEGLKSVYGNGLYTLQSLDVQNEYNVTIIEPSFGIQPWYADNPDEPGVRHEMFMTRELIPWVRATLTTTGYEQNWLIGFSKSGLGAQALLLKYPDLFDLAASWDFPADMSAHDEYGLGSVACYGTDANFQVNYRLTSQFVDTRRAPFLQDCRIWIGHGPVFMNNVSRYESMLAAAGVRYTAEATLDSRHRWDGGWLPAALAALQEFSIELARTAACDI